MLGKYSLFIASLFFVASIAKADPVTYNVSVDTSSIQFTVGSLDFQFNPGLDTTQAASLQILGFTSDGTLAGDSSTIGDAGGTLPGTLTFDNGVGFNDYFEGFTYGTTLSFEVSLYGPALSSPDGVSTSDSAFGFSMFSDPLGTIPTLTSDPEGFAVTLGVNPDGTTTVTNSSTGNTIVVTPSSVTPEPGSLVLLATGLLGIAGTVRRRLNT